MKMKLIITSLLVVLIIIVIFFGLSNESKKIAYIQNSKVFNEFEMTQELKKDLDAYVQQNKTILDSLQLKLKLIASNIDKSGDTSQLKLFNITRDEYQLREEDYYRGHDKITEDYNEKITTQMNEYITSFGKENGYTYILGANGTGSLMYAHEGEDVTDKVIAYINEKYEGR